MKNCLLVVLMIASHSILGQSRKAINDEYLLRSKEMFHRVWSLYRVPQYGLFSEYYPQKHTDSLTYMQDGKVESKVVSYLWPFSGVISAANSLARIPKERNNFLHYIDSCGGMLEMYRDTTRKPIGYQAYPVKFESVDRYYDDNGLVGIDYMEAYKNTKDKMYLKRAKEVFTFILSGWSDALGGGVPWLEGHNDQKPACSNGMATLTALKIFESTKDEYYLDWGVKFYNWMYSNLRDSAGLYWNDKKTAGGIVNRTYYTYNSGSMLEASVMLFQFTKQKKYLTEARTIAQSAFEFFGKTDANFRSEFCDLPWFTTVLFRGYEALYNVDKDSRYVKAITYYVDQAWEHRDQYGLMYRDWSCKTDEHSTPKWLLDEACIAELYARMATIAR